MLFFINMEPSPSVWCGIWHTRWPLRSSDLLLGVCQTQSLHSHPDREPPRASRWGC